MTPFRIKICGITNAADAEHAARTGADAVGLNFYRGSKRCISPDGAKEISAVLPRQVKRIGLFVNEMPDVIAEVSLLLGLDFIQLHGDEPPDYLAGLSKRHRVIKAFRLANRQGLDEVVAYVAECNAAGSPLAGVLIDAYSPQAYGGTGQTVDWDVISPAARRAASLTLPLILAGGLTEQNIAQAIATVQPDGVDVASGVESQPGVKDRQRVELFVAHAAQALGLKGQGAGDRRQD